MTIKIRLLEKKDEPELFAILRNTPEFTAGEVVIAEEVIDDSLDNPQTSGYYSLTAENEDGQIIGFVSYGPIPLTAYAWDIYWLDVKHEFQGCGTGASLLKAAEENILQEGGKMAFIETSGKPEYDKTRRFYTARGYSEICNIPDFYAPGDSKIIYRKFLG
ncbi:MAG: GNAT family N-acetyltransferase [Dehalococcoidales bacterium]